VLGLSWEEEAQEGWFRRRRSLDVEEKEGLVRTDTTMLVGGLVIALVAALLLFLGVIESGPAALVGIVGIGLIAGSVPLRNARS